MTKGDIVFAVLTVVAAIGEIVKLYGGKHPEMRKRLVFNGRCVGMWATIAATVVLSNTRAGKIFSDFMESNKLYAAFWWVYLLVCAEITLCLICAIGGGDNFRYWKYWFNYRANKLDYHEPSHEGCCDNIYELQTLLDGMERGEYGDGNKNLITLQDFDEFYGYGKAKIKQLKSSIEYNSVMKFGDKCKKIASFFLCLFPLYVVVACAAAVVFALI